MRCYLCIWVTLIWAVIYTSSDNLYYDTLSRLATNCTRKGPVMILGVCNACICESRGTLVCSALKCQQPRNMTRFEKLEVEIRDCVPKQVMKVDGCVSCRCLWPGVVKCILGRLDCLKDHAMTQAAVEYLYGYESEEVPIS